ncbi:hypothetical protein ABK040_007984 [Willaertia magna]
MPSKDTKKMKKKQATPKKSISEEEDEEITTTTNTTTTIEKEKVDQEDNDNKKRKRTSTTPKKSNKKEQLKEEDEQQEENEENNENEENVTKEVDNEEEEDDDEIPTTTKKTKREPGLENELTKTELSNIIQTLLKSKVTLLKQSSSKTSKKFIEETETKRDVKSREKLKKKLLERFHVKPLLSDIPKETELKGIATQGVIKLINMVLQKKRELKK